jgi:hypothetical protein
MKMFSPLLLALLLAIPAAAAAQQPAAGLPAWDQLTPQQREQLVAPVRERWNNSSQDKRAHLLDHAVRWQSMSPDERARARHGERRWRDMSPERREQARALFEHMKTLPEAERKAMIERWKAMTPDQRKAWVESHPPSRQSPAER